MKIQPNSRLIMIGDSVTDHGRAQPAGEGLFEAIGRGWGGYVAQVDALLQATYPDYHIRVTNKGTSGNQVRDLAVRWKSDVLNLAPDWLSIMIGINDVWRQFDHPHQPEAWVQPDEYATTYEKLLKHTRPLLKGLVLMTPYFMETNLADPMRQRMDQYGAIVKNLATQYDAILVDTQAAFEQVLAHYHPASIAWDRIHPNHIGYMILAKAFLNAIAFGLESLMITIPNHLQHRTAQATITLTTNGQALANQEVTVAQKKHQFLFGSNWGSSIALVNGRLRDKAKEQAERREALFLDLFNFATLPFYWGNFSHTGRGKPQTASVRKAAEHYHQHGCTTKGHPLCWHTVCADWLLPLSNAEIVATQMARIRRETGDFKGLVDMWDVVNEAVIMPVFDKYDNGVTRICQELGQIELIRQTFETARETDPSAILVLNDFDISPEYAELIEHCLDAGIQIDAIGIQSHMHQGWWGLEKTQEVLERFARFGLPLQFTEVTLVSGRLMPEDIVDLNDYQVEEWPTTPEGEERQTNESVAFYKELFTHPLTTAITWWDMIDGSWLNAPAGLIRADASPKPAYDALHKLIKGEWWLPPTPITTDAHGQIQFSGFLGDYELSYTDQRATFTLNQKGNTELNLSL